MTIFHGSNQYISIPITVAFIILCISHSVKCYSGSQIFSVSIPQPENIQASTIEKLALQITDQNGKILYPFTKQQDNQIFQCGSIASVKFKTEQIFYLFSQVPFIATVSSADSSVKVSGFTESIKIQSQNDIKNDQSITNKNPTEQHVGLLLVSKQCQSYFSYLHYLTNLSVTILQPNTTQQYFSPVTIQIPSLTYCLQESELTSLQFMFDMGYSVLFCIIASMLPTFPIAGQQNKFIVLVLLLVAQSNSQMQRVIFILAACFFVGVSNSKINEMLLQMERLKVYKLFKTSFASLVFCYFLAVTINWLHQPNRHYSGQNNFISLSIPAAEPSISYIIGLYLQNICQMLLIIQLISSVFCFNRPRTAFWWLSLTLSAYILHPQLYTLFPRILNAETFSQNAYFGLLLPSIFASSCQYRQLIPIILFAPVCYFIDRFQKVKFGGIVILVNLSIVGSLNNKLGIGLSLFWLFIWFIVSISIQGQFAIFTRRWLTYSQIRATGG